MSRHDPDATARPDARAAGAGRSGQPVVLELAQEALEQPQVLLLVAQHAPNSIAARRRGRGYAEGTARRRL
jgi:hypothetical protein